MHQKKIHTCFNSFTTETSLCWRHNAPFLICTAHLNKFLNLLSLTALQRTQLDPRLQSLIIQWHQEHSLSHWGSTTPAEAFQWIVEYVRGAAFAPYLWTAVMALLIDDLQTQYFHVHGCRQNLTIYADEYRYSLCFFTNISKLTQAVKYFEENHCCHRTPGPAD